MTPNENIVDTLELCVMTKTSRYEQNEKRQMKRWLLKDKAHFYVQ